MGSHRRPDRAFRRRLLDELALRYRALGCILLVSLALNLCGLAAPRLTQAVLQRVIPRSDISLLSTIMLGFIAVGVIQAALVILRRLALVRLSLAVDQSLATQIMARLLTLPAVGRRPAGELASYVRDSNQTRFVVAAGFSAAAIDAVMAIVYLILMASYSIRLTAVAASVLLVAALAGIALSPLRRGLYRRLLDDQAAQEARLVEFLAASDLIQATAAEAEALRVWGQSFHKHLDSNYRTQRARQLVDSAGSAVQNLGAAVLLGVGALLAARGDMDVASLVAFSMYAAQAVLPVTGFVSLWDEVTAIRASADRVDELFHQTSDPLMTESAASEQELRGHVRFEGVAFTYESGSNPVLRDLDLELRPGEHVALVGPSGAGKSTISRLLLGLVQPTSGRVLVDDTDLSDWNLRSYRQQVGTALQEGILLSGTVAENIALGDSKPDRARVEAAGAIAGVDTILESLPLGYETLIGERGATLSGGQRQRIGLARVLYRQPRLVILDEATSAIDPAGTAELRGRLYEALRDSTVLVIAHDPQALRFVDRVLYLHQGRVVEITGDYSLNSIAEQPWRELPAERISDGSPHSMRSPATVP